MLLERKGSSQMFEIIEMTMKQNTLGQKNITQDDNQDMFRIE